MTDGATTLTYAVRLHVVGRYLGQLSWMLGLLTLAPLIVSLVFGEYAFSWRYGVVTALLLLAGAGGRRLPATDSMRTNEGIVIVSLAFILAPIIMSFPLAASGLPFEDVLFEAISGVTTTGLSTVDTVGGRSSAFLFARAWMQWFGGLGIAVLSVALFMGHHAAARRLAESSGSYDPASTARAQARQALRVYLLLTLVGTLLLWFLIGDGFSALVHMLATVSTGGFSPFDESLAAIPRSAAWVITAFSFLGAIPLLLYFHALEGRPAGLLRDIEVRTLVILVLAAAGFLTLGLHNYSGLEWSEALPQALMLGTSAQTTAGFSALDVGELDPASKLSLIISMLIGGSSGSTAGGIKLLRILLILRLLQHFVQRTAMPPHAVAEPRLAGRIVEPLDAGRASLVVALFIATLSVSWMVFVAYGYAPLDALFEVGSALGTVGLSTGITAPDLETPLKILLCADMLMGRLEILALVVLLYPRTWLGRRG